MRFLSKPESYIALAMAFILSACVSAPIVQTKSTTRSPSNDGKPSAPDSPLFKHSARLTFDGISFCSGYLINEFTVLTAAHCFKQTLPNRMLNGRFKVFIGGNEVSSPYRAYVSRNFDFKELRPTLATDDIAVIVFRKQVSHKPFIRVFTEPLDTLSLHDHFSSIGYGTKPVEINEAADSPLATEIALKLQDESDDEKIETIAGEMFPGDSGSPLFIRRDNEFFLVGVLSGTGEGDELKESFWIKTVRHAEFIKSPAKNGKLILFGN